MLKGGKESEQADKHDSDVDDLFGGGDEDEEFKRAIAESLKMSTGGSESGHEKAITTLEISACGNAEKKEEQLLCVSLLYWLSMTN